MTQEVDDPFQLDMSELCLSEGLSRNMRDNGTGKITKMDLYSLLLVSLCSPIHHTIFLAFLAWQFPYQLK